MKNNATNNLNNEVSIGKDNDNDINIINTKDTNIGKINDYQKYNKENSNKNIVYNNNESMSFQNYSAFSPKKIEEEKYFYNDKINYTYKPKKIETIQQKPIIYNNKNTKNITHELLKTYDSTLKKKQRKL
jgi:hypothetical protein